MNILEIRNELSRGKSIYDLPLRVTFYARVSTNKYEQVNSLQNQIDYFKSFIKASEAWAFVDGYIDEGISGKSAKKRKSFLKMIADAKQDKFDLIITKSISRFSRDTLDSLKYTRELLEYGKAVLFQSDNLCTFMPDSELRLTVMTSMAQEELRKLSDNVRFGFRKQIDKGSVLGNNSIWGYDKDVNVNHGENKRLIINEAEAEVVRKIFDMYVNEHIGMRSIGNKLADEGIYNRNGNPITQGTIKSILTNPKYKGYYCGNKTVTISYYSDKRINIDESDWKVYEDNNAVPPIVSEDIWDKAQLIVKERSKKYCKDKVIHQNRYPLSGKIICMEHNEKYRRKKQISSGIKRKEVVTWRCKEYLNNNKEACNSPNLYEDEIIEIVGKSILKYLSDVKIIDELMAEYKKQEGGKNYGKEISTRQFEIKNKEIAKNKLFDLFEKEAITEDDFIKQNKKLSNDIDRLEKEIESLQNNNKSIINNYKYLDKVRKKAAEKLRYEKADVNKLIYEFLDRVEVYNIKDDVIKLKIVLNTGNDTSIYFNYKEHTLCTYYPHDKSRCRINLRTNYW